jgi:hypothetical protein
MYFSKRFEKKFKSFYPDISSTDYEVAFNAWENILDSENFEEKDLIEIMDNLVKRGNLGYVMEVNPINFVVNHPRFVDLFFELPDNTIEKYKDFFISVNVILSLNDIPEFVVYHYGDNLNWEIILENTLNEEVDGTKINNDAYTLINVYHEIMFSNEIQNSSYKPAPFHHFFKCLELGAEIPYDYMKKSMMNGNTTFSSELIDFVNYSINANEIEEFEGFIYVSYRNARNEDQTINVCFDHILRRLLNDEEMLEFLEEIDFGGDDEIDEEIVTDFDIDDDLGF